MSKHAAISPGEAADRLAIRELVEAYAYCADRRDAAGQMALFTPDTHFVVYMDAKNPTPSGLPTTPTMVCTPQSSGPTSSVHVAWLHNFAPGGS